MRRGLISLFVFLFVGVTCFAQRYDFDKIVLAPNIETTQVKDGKANKILKDRLSQLAIISGFTSNGIDDRFVITAHAVELESVCLPTMPTRYSVELMVTIYVGDGELGTLFSSYSVQVKGVGNDNDDAYASAYRRIYIRDPRLIESIQYGGQKIIDYYNANAEAIISRAKAMSKQGNYDQAIYELFMIPSTCGAYNRAQELAGNIASEASERYNDQVITRARACWAASPDASGADQAQRILTEMRNPSSGSIKKAQQLTNEMAARLENVEDQRLKLERAQAQYAHSERMAEIKADAQVERTRINANARQNIASINAARDIAVSYYNSRPRRVYHYHWW